MIQLLSRTNPTNYRVRLKHHLHSFSTIVLFTDAAIYKFHETCQQLKV